MPAPSPVARADHPRHARLARLRGIARSRMWTWLFDAHRLLGVTVEVLDDQFGALVPSREGRTLRESVERTRAESLSRLLDGVRDAPQVITAGDVRLACAPIVGAGSIAGAVLVGTDGHAHLQDADIAGMSALIADAIADQLSRPPNEHRGNLHQISALYQLLHTAISSGSEHEVIRTFAEALSIWEDVEVLAYRADLNGRYTLAMALPGSDPALAPSVLDHDPMPDEPGVMRLSAGDRAALGFGGGNQTLLARLVTDGGPWLIAMNAAGDHARSERSELYVAALGHALNGCVAVERSRLTWAVMQQFVDVNSPYEAARRALDELGRTLSAAGRFTISRPDGTTILTVGDTNGSLQMPARSVMDARTLRCMVAAPSPYAAVLELHAAIDRPFTRRDARLFDAAAASFGAWLPAALRRIAGGERRGVARSFDQIVDRYTREAHASHDDASLILISAGDCALPLDTTHAWIKRLRPQLRPTDLAGRLASGELGILLLQTSQSGAQVVARRLWRVLATRGFTDEPAIRIGIASQTGDHLSADALIERARLQPLDRAHAAG